MGESDKKRRLLMKKDELGMRIWGIYGNNGPKHTFHNHRFIQKIYQGEMTFEEALEEFSPTEECVNVVRDHLEKWGYPDPDWTDSNQQGGE